MTDKQALTDLLEPTVSGLGYELVELELAQGGSLLRLYIDGPAGIALEDCERVSHQVSGVLDVADPLAGRYQLEVSSPGLDRPLVKPAHFSRFVGHDVKIRLKAELEGRRRFAGRLVDATEDDIGIEVDGEPHRFSLGDIERARLVPEI